MKNIEELYRFFKVKTLFYVCARLQVSECAPVLCMCLVCLGARPNVHIGSLPLGLSSLLFEARSLIEPGANILA